MNDAKKEGAEARLQAQGLLSTVMRNSSRKLRMSVWAASSSGVPCVSLTFLTRTQSV